MSDFVPRRADPFDEAERPHCDDCNDTGHFTACMSSHVTSDDVGREFEEACDCIFGQQWAEHERDRRENEGPRD